jgi:hypothetical protein
VASLTRIAFRSAATAVVFAVALSCAAAPAFAQPTEWEVKAAFLPRFARYVTWPPAAMPKGDAPFVLCVIGSDPFGPALDQAVRSQTIDGRRIAVRRLDSAAAADGCHIAFVAGGRSGSAGQLLGALGRRPVLAVTDSGNGGARGIIQFTIVDGRVRFFIDQSSAQQRGLAISSRLLALAVGVRH